DVANADSAKQATRFIRNAFKGISRLRHPARKLWDTIISQSFVSSAGIFSFTALLMLPGTSAEAGLAKPYAFVGVRPSSAAATSACSSGSDCPNATGSPFASAPEDGRTPLNTSSKVDERLSDPVDLSAEGFADEFLSR